MNRALTAPAAVLLICGAIAGTAAVTSNASSEAPAACDGASTETPGGVSLTVTCLVPTPPPVTETATSTVTATTTATATVTQTVTATPTTTTTPTPTEPPTEPPAALKVIGMSAPSAQWNQRLSEVGANGIRARRIFADLTSTGNDQGSLITQAHAAGMLPVVSYKLPSVTSAISGSYDTWARNAALFLASFNKPTAVTVWHEPHGDMTPAQFVAMQERLVPILEANCSLCEVGPILNGWLLDRRRADFESYMSPTLLNEWEWVGIDTYQNGDLANPGDTIPGDRMAPLLDVLADAGHADMPVGIGENNGFTAQAIADSGEVWLSTPTLWFACIFNSSTGGRGVILTGDRLAAFKSVKADARVQQ